MIYSKRITELQQIYSVSIEDVFFAILVGHGCTRTEAAAIIYKPKTANEASIESFYSKLQRQKPGIAKLIKSIENEKITPNQINKLEKADKQRNERVDLTKIKTKEGILTLLTETIPALTGKEKADVLMKIADLQQMKKEENKEEEERVLFYHPLQCYRCSLFKQAREKSMIK